MEARLEADDSQVLSRAAALLEEFNQTAPRLLAQNFGVAIAVLIHRTLPGGDPGSGPPKLVARPDSGDPISTHDLQVEVCDQTYGKREDLLPAEAEGPIYKPFTNSFKPRSPSNNNWRNSYDLQGGLGCDAPYSADFLQSATYLGEPRFDCQFRDPATGRCDSPSGYTDADRTCFNPNKRGAPPGPESTAQHRPKLLTRGELGTTHGYWYVEPTVDVLVDLLAAPDRRVPLYPFMATMYAASPYFGQWGAEISRSRFEADIRLDAERFSALFDPDPDSELNRRLLAGGPPSTDKTPAASVPRSQGPVLSNPVPYQERTLSDLTVGAESQADPARRTRLLERARQGHQRALEALAGDLGARGEFELTEQLDGYDLLAVADDAAYLFEVKTWTPANLADQVRRGWAQLREYRYRNRENLPDDTKLFLVLDRPPPPYSWVWEFLVADCDVVPTWIHEGTLSTRPEFEDLLP